MLEYLQKVASETETIAKGKDRTGMIERFGMLATELDRLNAEDFEPDAQRDFVEARALATKWSKMKSYTNRDKPADAAALIGKVVSRYRGANTGRSPGRTFASMAKADLRIIVERDYEELLTKLLPSHAWKSAVVMAGSILETLLYYHLTNNPAQKALAMASSKAARKKGVVIDPETDEWKLYQLIEVAADIGVLNKQREKTIDQVLRDYRNFVHPKVEIKAAHPCSEAEATLAKGALDGVLNHLGY